MSEPWKSKWLNTNALSVIKQFKKKIKDDWKESLKWLNYNLESFRTGNWHLILF